MNCGYHLNPYKNGYAKDNTFIDNVSYQINKPLVKPKPIFIPKEILYKTRTAYQDNVFVQNLLSNIKFPFNPSDVEKVIAQYHLGTITRGYRKGATTFPFIDIDDNVRAIQVKQFNNSNHTAGTDFLHSIIEKHYNRTSEKIPKWLKEYNTNETKVSCLFGEHLLSKYPHNPIALVEAPKTAVYGTLYFGFPNNPKNLLWLAVYNLSSLNLKKCKALKSRKVFLFPDLSKQGRAYKLWTNKSLQIQQQLEDSFFKVSALLELLAPEQDRIEGKDIADYLIELDWRSFRKEEVQKTITVQPQQHTEITITKTQKQSEITKTSQVKSKNCTKIEDEDIYVFQEIQKEDWTQQIIEIETLLKQKKIPTVPIKLNASTVILNPLKFIESHIATVKANNGNLIYLPYLERIQNFSQFLMRNSFRL
jgi:hypothetical protein